MYYENYNENQGEEKAFIKWINSLGLTNELGESIHVNNLYEDLKNGLILLNIIDKIKPGVVKWKIVEKKNLNPFKIGVNCTEVIESCKRLNCQIHDIGGGDIRNGNKKCILKIIWEIMKAYILKEIGNKTEEELISWGNERVSNKEISKLKLDLDNERNNNKELVKKISKLEKELNDEKNKNKILEENISRLKNELDNLLNKTKKQEEKTQNRNSDNNSKESLYETILEKDKEIKNLKLKLSRYPVELDEGEELISVIFISGDQKLHCSIICKNTDKFNRVEDRLYDCYSEYAENENYFTFNGIKINKYKTLKDNNIKNNNIIMLNTIE